MVYFTYTFFFLIFVVIFSNKVRKKLKKVLISRTFREYLIFLINFLIAASSSVVGMSFLAISASFAMRLGIISKLSDSDILMQSQATIFFIAFYGTIQGSMLWFLKEKIKGKKWKV